jgi:hypothetical protein
VERVGGRKVAYRVLVGDLREIDHMKDPGVDGRILLKWIFVKWDSAVWTGFIWLRIWTVDGLLLMR